jgi:hypothetical protein
MRQHGARVLSTRDLQLLRLVGEQYAVTITQLAYLTGRSERTARWLRTRWERAGLAQGQKPLTYCPTIVWATGTALTQVGLPFRSFRPHAWLVERIGACLELRLACEKRYPGGEFVSRRRLAHEQPQRRDLPDGVVRVDDAEIALVVEQGLGRTTWDIKDRLASLGNRYTRTLLIVHPRLREVAEAAASDDVVIASWQWSPWIVSPPHLPPLSVVLPGLDPRPQAVAHV